MTSNHEHADRNDRQPRTTAADGTVQDISSDVDSSDLTRPDSDTVPTQQASEKTADGGPQQSGQPGRETLPRTVGQYRLLKKLGEGGMGAVYLAEHERLRRPVALKTLTIQRMRSAAALARFQREMAAAGRLSHPNIVITHDAGDAAGVHYLAMELIEGVDLGQILQLGPLSVADACEIARQAALGLDYAHQCNLLHRDIKPSNLMLGRTASDAGIPALTVKILDLGLARLDMTHDDEEELTAEGQMMGTIDYIAPEQADGGRVGRWSDIYSLGATLYKMLSGAAPYAESGKTLLEKLAALSRGPAPSIRTRVDLPSGLADLVDAMISPNPADRPASAAIVAERLAGFAVGAELAERLQETEEAVAAGRTVDERTWSVLRERVPSTAHSSSAPNKQVAAPTVAETGMPAWQWIAIAAIVAAIALLLTQAPLLSWLNKDDGVIDVGDDVIVARAPDSPTPTREDRTPGSTTGSETDRRVASGASGGASGAAATRDPAIRSPAMSDPGIDGGGTNLGVGGGAAVAPLGQPPVGRVPGSRNARPDSLKFQNGTLPEPFPRAAQGMAGLPAGGPAPESQVAKWFSSRGGQVEALRGNERFQYRDSATTPAAYDITSLDAKRKVAVNDANIVMFRDLRQLEVARLANTEITDAALSTIAKNIALKELDLSETQITSKGIPHLAPLVNLEVLRLKGTAVDDAAVPDLGRLMSLRLLDVRETEVTEAGKARLNQLLPSAKLP